MKKRMLVALLLITILVSGCARQRAAEAERAPVPSAPTVSAPAGSPEAVYHEGDALDLSVTAEDLAKADQVEYVAFRTPGKVYVDSGGPLYGSEQTREKIAMILSILRRAEPVSDPQGIWSADTPIDRYLAIHYRDGHEDKVDLAWWRQPTSSLMSIPGRHIIYGQGEVSSRELDWFYRMGWREIMPAVRTLQTSPSPLNIGDPLTITGQGWIEGESVIIYFMGFEKPVELGRARIGQGVFTWTGLLPAGIEPYEHKGGPVPARYYLKIAVDGHGEIPSSLPPIVR